MEPRGAQAADDGGDESVEDLKAGALEADQHPRAGMAVAALPGELREALVLFEYEGLRQAEIAATLGCSVKAVESRVARAKEKLRVALGRWV